MDNTTNSTGNGTFEGSSNSTFEGWQSQQPPKPFWTNLTLPVLYLTIVIGSLYAFSTLYRKRQISKAANLEPWFPPHKPRDIYLSLMHLDPAEASEADEKKLKQVPDSVLKAALLRRAVEDIKRIVQLRSSKDALQRLLQRGSVGEELWQRFQRAEKEMEEEVKDVVAEANAFSQNWGQTIFQSANEINQNDLLKQRTADIQSQLEAEKEWWAKKREGVREDFMKELEGDSKPVETQRKAGSDDDAVLVEAEDSAPQGGGGGGKKKKGKK